PPLAPQIQWGLPPGRALALATRLRKASAELPQQAPAKSLARQAGCLSHGNSHSSWGNSAVGRGDKKERGHSPHQPSKCPDASAVGRDQGFGPFVTPGSLAVSSILGPSSLWTTTSFPSGLKTTRCIGERLTPRGFLCSLPVLASNRCRT